MKLVQKQEDIPNEVMAVLFSVWDSLKGDDLLPVGSRLGEYGFDTVSAFCKFAQVDEENRVRYVKVGDAIKELYGQDFEGAYLDELFDPWVRKAVVETYETCISQKKVIYERKGFSTIIGSVGYEYLLMPFCGEDGTSVQKIVSCLMPLDAKIKKDSDWREAVSVTPWLKR